MVPRLGDVSWGSFSENWILILLLLQSFFHDTRKIARNKAFIRAVNGCSSGGARGLSCRNAFRSTAVMSFVIYG